MKSKRHHYNPQFMLRGFATGQPPRLYQFDVRTSAVQQLTVKDAGLVVSLYDVKVDGQRQDSFEPFAKKFDDIGAPVIKKIRETRSLTSLEEREQQYLALFISFQLIRTPRFLRECSSLQGLDTEVAHAARETPNANARFSVESLGLLAALVGFVQNWRSVVYPLLEKHWLLLEAPQGEVFFVGDHPVALFNENRTGLIYDLTPRTPGVSVFFPVSSTLLLCLQSPAGFPAGPRPAPAKALSLRMTHRLTAQDVAWLNRRQVVWADRFLFCENDGFAGIAEAFKVNPEMRAPGLPTWMVELRSERSS